MTIKPVIAPTQNKRGGGGGGGNGSGNSNSTTDTEKKETLGQVVGEQDAHGQSRSEAVYEELTRGHRRSPHKSPRIKRRDHHEQHSHGHGHSHSHSHGHHIHKRERSGVEKLTTNVNAVVNAAGNIIPKCQSPHSSHSSNVGGLGLASSSLGAGAVGGLNTVGSGGNNSPAHNNNLSSMSSLNAIGKASPEHLSAAARSVLGLGCSPLSAKNSNVLTPAGAAANLLKAIEDTYSGYNSGDEHLQPKEDAISVEEWQRRDEQFAKCMQERDYILKNVEEDGACLFRAISLQIYGDEEMHDVIRQHTMDYIYKNREYFSHFVTEDINSYIKRKRRKDSHGNHIEIQAMSEIYNRPVEVYCYKPKPINIFNSEQLKNGYAPLRLSYQRGSHYNAIIDPYNATVGVGLGLAGYKPDLQTKEAARLSEQLEIEQTMFEDKLKTTDWEATNEAIEEQIARESYLQWCRDNLQRSRNSTATSSTSATITSAEAMDAANAAPSHQQYAFMPRNGYTLSSGGGGPTSSTITSGAVLSMALSALPSATATSSSTESAGVSTLAATNQILGAALANVTAAVNGAGGGGVGGGAGSLSPRQSQAQSELGYASDDTDMSSTSSVSYHSSGTGGDKSPGTVAAQKHRSKKSKSRSNATPVRTHKKRRCDQQQQQQQKSSAAAKSTNAEADLGAEGGGSSSSMMVTRKSPKPHAKSPIATRARSRSLTPEQQPCTSKQSNTPEKQQEQSALPAAPSTEQQQKPAGVEKQPDSDKQQQESDNQQQKTEMQKSEQGGGEEKSAAQQKTSSPSRNQSFTSFYQELLEASYATDGYGQLSESEMLQRAIQMSTQDYIQDQQRKYLYGP